MVKRKRDKAMYLRLTEEERLFLHEVAKKQGLTVTDFILKMAKEKENA